jgi:hypothetical protein
MIKDMKLRHTIIELTAVIAALTRVGDRAMASGKHNEAHGTSTTKAAEKVPSSPKAVGP